MLVAVVTSLVLAISAVPASRASDELLWSANGHITHQAVELMAALRGAEAYGLEPGDYELRISPSEMRAVLDGNADATTRKRVDGALSETAARFAHDLRLGRVDPRAAGFRLPVATATIDTSGTLHQLASSTDVARTIASFEPSLPPYRRLEAALARYRQLAKDPGLTQLPPLSARSVAPGDPYAGAQALRHLLATLGDLASETPPADGDAGILDAALADGIKHFQERHGLEPDGVLGQRTFAALTTHLSKRVTQIELAMERWRWLTPLGRPDIVVNIPQFTLITLPRSDEPRDDALEMRVIVGQTSPRKRTPVFATQITQVIFQPYWDVPRSILIRELLPLIRQNPAYLDKHDMEIVDGETDNSPVVEPTPAAIAALEAGRLRLRQRPGPLNALGPVKFYMANPYDVYMHATPEQALFSRSQRTYSHGCIRVNKPAELAAYVLRNALEPWDRAAIDAALCGTTTQRVPLKKPVPVIVMYSTAVATRSEGVLFFDDAYGYDRKLEQLLGAGDS